MKKHRHKVLRSNLGYDHEFRMQHRPGWTRRLDQGAEKLPSGLRRASRELSSIPTNETRFVLGHQRRNMASFVLDQIRYLASCCMRINHGSVMLARVAIVMRLTI